MPPWTLTTTLGGAAGRAALFTLRAADQPSESQCGANITSMLWPSNDLPLDRTLIEIWGLAHWDVASCSYSLFAEFSPPWGPKTPMAIARVVEDKPKFNEWASPTTLLGRLSYRWTVWLFSVGFILSLEIRICSYTSLLVPAQISWSLRMIPDACWIIACFELMNEVPSRIRARIYGISIVQGQL